MRARFAAGAASLLLVSCSEAFALWLGVPDFRQVVQEADLCIDGRVALARVLREEGDEGDKRHHDFACLAEIEVDHVLFGPCKQGERITVYYGDWEIDDTSFAPRERYVLFLNRLPPPLQGYASRVIHWGVFEIAEDLSIRMPERLGGPPRLREPGNVWEFFEEIRYVRGPRITIRPTKKSFRWDEPVTLEATFTNPLHRPSPREMKLLFAPPPLEEFSYVDQYLTARGLPVCGPVSRVADNPRPVEVTLAAEESATRNVTIRPHFRKRAKHRLDSIAFVALEYSTGCVQDVEGAWKGSAFSGPAPIEIVCDEADFARGLADAGEDHAFRLKIGDEEVAPGERAGVSVVASRRMPSADEGRLVRTAFASGRWRLNLRLPDDHLAALVGQMEVTRDGRRIDMQGEKRRAASWLRELVEGAGSGMVETPAWMHLGVYFDLARFFDLTVPGRYAVRLVVPREETGEKRSLASNVIEFSVAASAPDEE